MALKQCDKCSEMVDEAKAFCPGCGSPFVEEEKRQQASSFDKMDSTVQLGQTMYNEMLSEMGLKAAKIPKPSERSVGAGERRIEMVAPLPAAVKKPETAPDKSVAGGNVRWFLIGGALALVFALVVLGAVYLFVRFWPR